MSFLFAGLVIGLVLIILLCVLCLFLFRAYNELNRNDNNAQHLLFALRKWDARDEQQKKYMEKKLQSMHYGEIAIYGCGVLGKRMARDLEESDIEISCFIDRNIAVSYKDIPVLHDLENMPQVDAVIVTVVSQYYAIREQLYNKVRCPIVSVEDLL